MQPCELVLTRFIDHAAKWHPDREIVTATQDSTFRTGYAELQVRAGRLSSALTSLGVDHGDRVATLLWNNQAHMECLYACLGLGAVYHTLNPRLTVDQMARMVDLADDRIIAVEQDQLDVALALRQRCASVAHIILFDEGRAGPLDERADHDGVRRHSALLAAHPAPAPRRDLDEHSPAGLCFTSGTTSDPKGVMYTHRSNYLHTLTILQPDILGLSRRDCVLAVVPMFHANGWGLPFAAPAVGAKLVLPGRWTSGAALARLIREEAVTIAFGVPTVWLALLDHLDDAGGDLPALERIVLGGAAVSQALVDRLERRLGVVVQTSWGMTELSPLGTMTPPCDPDRAATQVGRPSIGVDLCLFDENGQPLAAQRGHEGRLKAKGPSVIDRYFGEDEPAVDGEGWFDTGDLAVLDDEGRLTITGRAKDLIKSGGEWINPVQIEQVVGTMAGIDLAAVVGKPDATWGERPVLVIKECDAGAVTDAAILQALAQTVPKWWLPADIVRLEQFPYASTGKIDKHRLRALLAA